jgi:hypothetical protein
MGGGPEGYPQGYGGYGMQIPPVQARPGTSSFPFPSPASAPNAPAQAIDTSMFVRRSEEDTRFSLLESRLHVDEESMESMRDTIRRVCLLLLFPHLFLQVRCVVQKQFPITLSVNWCMVCVCRQYMYMFVCGVCVCGVVCVVCVCARLS